MLSSGETLGPSQSFSISIFGQLLPAYSFLDNLMARQDSGGGKEMTVGKSLKSRKQKEIYRSHILVMVIVEVKGDLEYSHI